MFRTVHGSGWIAAGQLGDLGRDLVKVAHEGEAPPSEMKAPGLSARSITCSIGSALAQRLGVICFFLPRRTS